MFKKSSSAISNIGDCAMNAEWTNGTATTALPTKSFNFTERTTHLYIKWQDWELDYNKNYISLVQDTSITLETKATRLVLLKSLTQYFATHKNALTEPCHSPLSSSTNQQSMKWCIVPQKVIGVDAYTIND